MTIAELGAKGNAALGRLPKDFLVVLILVLASSASFGLGVLAGREAGGPGQGSGFSITEVPLSGNTDLAAAASAAADQGQAISPAPATIPAGGQVVASKNGTKYYLPWCGGVKAIKEENKVWFASAEEAKAKGYTPAANCKGL